LDDTLAHLFSKKQNFISNSSFIKKPAKVYITLKNKNKKLRFIFEKRKPLAGRFFCSGMRKQKNNTFGSLAYAVK
jgi:hypothetical protein